MCLRITIQLVADDTAIALPGIRTLNEGGHRFLLRAEVERLDTADETIALNSAIPCRGAFSRSRIPAHRPKAREDLGIALDDVHDDRLRLIVGIVTCREHVETLRRDVEEMPS